MVKLTPVQVQFYKDNGYIKLSNIFTEQEVDEIDKEYDRIYSLKYNPEMETSWTGVPMSKAVKSGKSVQAIHNLQYHSAVFSRLLHNTNLLDALEGVMATPDILLHQNKAHRKPPVVGAPYLMHQDYHYLPLKNDTMVTAFIHLSKCDPENGGLCIYPGSHKNGPLEDFGGREKMDPYGNHYHWVDPAKYPIEKATPVNAERGDVVLFSYLTLYGSYANVTDRPRSVFLVQVRAADDEPLSDLHQCEGQGWVLRGKNDHKKAIMEERFLH